MISVVKSAVRFPSLFAQHLATKCFVSDCRVPVTKQMCKYVSRQNTNYVLLDGRCLVTIPQCAIGSGIRPTKPHHANPDIRIRPVVRNSTAGASTYRVPPRHHLGRPPVVPHVKRPYCVPSGRWHIGHQVTGGPPYLDCRNRKTANYSVRSLASVIGLHGALSPSST